MTSPSLYISWSSLRSHEECRQKAYLVRSGKKAPSANIRPYFHGTVVDRVMREWLEQSEDERKSGQMSTWVEDILNREELKAIETGDGTVKWKNRTDKANTIEWCKELVARLEPILDDLVTPHDYASAMRFRAPVQIPYLSGEPTWIMLAGEMDLLVRDKQPRFHIWDLKGTSDDSYWRKTIGQIVFYDLATHALYGEYSERAGLIQPMCKAPVVEIRVTDQMRAELMGRVIRMAHDMWQKDVRPKESNSGCLYCAVHHACEKFQRPNLMANGPADTDSSLDNLLSLPLSS